ncbi:MAG: DUF4062 domain-containing protein [Anaerolineaceae bacterium]|nr:DUF4062 domain-containing protein [Anaerolineaceae bacterium]
MSQSTQTFRIFVSSTFSDLKAERNALQARVFPRLRELAAKHNYRFQVIDLRWGVSEEASLDQQAMNICLGEVKRCQQISPRPNFIVLLGDRYGWLPPSPQINAEIFKRILDSIEKEEDRKFLQDWYILDENAVPAEWLLKPREKGSDFEKYSNWQPVETRLQKILSEAAEIISLSIDDQLPFYASATEQEIAAGAEKQKDSPDHVGCFFRSIDRFPEKFDVITFLELLEKRILEEYPNGISPTSKQHLLELKNVGSDFSAKELAEIIHRLNENTPKNTPEKEILGLMNQMLVDFTGKDFLNLIENEWIIDRPALENQNDLKDRLKSKLQQHVFNYKATWTGAGITSEHIDQLCQDVYSFLERIILEEINNPHTKSKGESKLLKIEVSKYRDSEGNAHHAFAEERLKFFVGRTEILENIDHYLQSNENEVLGIVGTGGTGKSALIAKTVEATQKKYPDAIVVFRFIGATPPSSDGRNLLEGLCKEISRCYGESETDIPNEYKDLIPTFHKKLKLANQENPLYLFLDSLDQLSNNHGARNLNWIPMELPPNVRVIITTREEDTFEYLKSKTSLLEILGGLSRKEGDVLLTQWLTDAGRTLQTDQRDEITNKFMVEDLKSEKKITAGNPLYLKLAFEEAKLWKSFTPVENLFPGIHGIIKKNMFDRLMNESNHGEKLVSHALGYLAASRYGLSEDELVDLLSRDFEVYDWFFKKSYHVPSDLLQRAIEYKRPFKKEENEPITEPSMEEQRVALNWLKDIRTPPEEVSDFLQKVLIKPDGPMLPIVLWSRLSFDLAPYLSERLLEKIPLLNFYHRELGEVSSEVFLGGDKENYYHEKLADYFKSKADPQNNKSWLGKNIHGLSELPYHLTKAGNRDAVFEVLTDFKFLEHKAEEVGISKAIDENGFEQINSDGVQQLQNDYRFALDTLYTDGSGVNSGKAPLIRTAEKYGEKHKVYCPVCNRTSTIHESQIGKTITCPHQDCQTPLKLNVFVTEMD